MFPITRDTFKRLPCKARKLPASFLWSRFGARYLKDLGFAYLFLGYSRNEFLYAFLLPYKLYKVVTLYGMKIHNGPSLATFWYSVFEVERICFFLGHSRNEFLYTFALQYTILNGYLVRHENPHLASFW